LPALSGDALFCGFYLNELLLKLLARDDAHERLFDCYEEALRTLGLGAEEAGVLRGFERELLREIGYALNLTHEPRTARRSKRRRVMLIIPSAARAGSA